MQDEIVAFPRFDLAAAREFQDNLAIVFAEWQAVGGAWSDDVPLQVSPDPHRADSWLFHSPDGLAIGRVTNRHKVGAALASGGHIARAVLRTMWREAEPPCLIRARVRAWTGPPGVVYEPPVFQPKIYLAPVVGEQFHREAVARCVSGQPVLLKHETGNPHDPSALAVISQGGARIGYIPQGHWLQRAVVTDGNGCIAQIHEVVAGSRGFPQVVLNVRLEGPPVDQMVYDGGKEDNSAGIAIVGAAVLFILVVAFALLSRTTAAS